MIKPFLTSVLLRISLFGLSFEFVDVFNMAAATFALILFSLTLRAWFVRRQCSLLMVAVAFVAFFLEILVEIWMDYEGLRLNLVSGILNFICLSLFFLAAVVRPSRYGKKP